VIRVFWQWGLPKPPPPMAWWLRRGSLSLASVAFGRMTSPAAVLFRPATNSKASKAMTSRYLNTSYSTPYGDRP
jgi:hypothetical protein